MTMFRLVRRSITAVIVIVVGALVGIGVAGNEVSSNLSPSSLGQTSSTAEVASPPVETPAAEYLALDVLEFIPIVAEHRHGYARDLFAYPIEATGDGCNTRDVVLIRDSLTPAQVDPDGCRVVAGDWYSIYDDVTWTDPAEVEIDHVLALGEAHDSGAWEWSPQRMRDFANNTSDPRMLRAVTGTVNQTKGADDPADWLPPNESFVCAYLSEWVGLKASWSLSMDQPEHDTIGNLLAERCPDVRVALIEVPE